MKRQEDEGEGDPSIEELCHDRPADEYFRLNTDGDCRDVVRYVFLIVAGAACAPLEVVLPAVPPAKLNDRQEEQKKKKK